MDCEAWGFQWEKSTWLSWENIEWKVMELKMHRGSFGPNTDIQSCVSDIWFPLWAVFNRLGFTGSVRGSDTSLLKSRSETGFDFYQKKNVFFLKRTNGLNDNEGPIVWRGSKMILNLYICKKFIFLEKVIPLLWHPSVKSDATTEVNKQRVIQNNLITELCKVELD